MHVQLYCSSKLFGKNCSTQPACATAQEPRKLAQRHDQSPICSCAPRQQQALTWTQVGSEWILFCCYVGDEGKLARAAILTEGHPRCLVLQTGVWADGIAGTAGLAYCATARRQRLTLGLIAGPVQRAEVPILAPPSSFCTCHALRNGIATQSAWLAALESLAAILEQCPLSSTADAA